MQIQVNTDNHTEGSSDLTSHCESVVQDTLRRFADRITRVEIHLSDENSSQKAGDDDKRCVMEARLAGMQPVSVTGTGVELMVALDDAAEKMEKLLSRTVDKQQSAKGRTSYAGDQLI